MPALTVAAENNLAGGASLATAQWAHRQCACGMQMAWTTAAVMAWGLAPCDPVAHQAEGLAALVVMPWMAAAGASGFSELAILLSCCVTGVGLPQSLCYHTAVARHTLPVAPAYIAALEYSQELSNLSGGWSAGEDVAAAASDSLVCYHLARRVCVVHFRKRMHPRHLR